MLLDLFTFENITALITLSFLEIILGIDNLIFITILVDKVEKSKQELARKLGLSLALITRVILLLFISAIMQLNEPLFTIFEQGFSIRDLILLVGGLFLIAKATFEIHDKIEDTHADANAIPLKSSFLKVIIQIGLLDIVFSLDSVITAIGMAKDIRIMIAAIMIAIVVMLVFAKSVADFVNTHPTFKILALSFLLLIGVVLVAESFGQHVSKGYIYSAIGFSLFVETINIKIRKPKVT